MTRTEVARGPLPQPIAQALRRLIHRVRLVVLVRGVSAVIATAGAAILLIMAIDAAVILFADWSRWVLTLSALAATVAAAVWFLILPMARTITLAGIALAIEEHHPEMQERISSAVELLTSRDLPEIRGSEVLIAELAKEASQEARHVQPRVEIPLKAARPYLLAAMGAIAVFAALLVLYPNASRLLARAVAPYLNLPNISADMLRVTPGDAVLAEGQRLQVQVDVANPAVRRAEFRKMMPDGSESIEAMITLPPGENEEQRFAITCPPAAESFRYRVHSGDALSRYYNVTVVPPPVVKRFDVRYEYPAYTRLGPALEVDSPGEIKAVVGTQVTVTAVTNKPVKSADLRINGQPVPQLRIEIGTEADGTSVCRFQVRLSRASRGRWALDMTDEYGFSNSSGERPIEALPDTPPVVKVLAPENKKLRLKPTDRLPVGYAMTDDYGLRSADFTIETDARKHATVAVALPDAGTAPRKAAAGEATLDLSKLPLQAAKQFTFRLRAADTLPKDLKGPQEGYSEVVTVELDISAASYAMQVLDAEEEAIRKALEKILAELKKSKEDSVPLKDQLPRIETLAEDHTKRIDRMRGHLGVAKGTVANLVPKVADGTFAGMTPKLNDLGAEVDGANDKSGQIKLTDTAAERGSLAAQTDQHIDRAIALVLELLKQLKEMADAVQLAQSLQDLADRQAELASEKAEMEQGAQAEASPADWQKAEAQVSRETGSLVKATPSALQAQLAQDSARAKDLAAEARRLEKEQQALAQDTSKLNQLQQTDNALKGLAAEQKALAQAAAGTPIAADQSKTMNAAADNIQAAQLAQAVQQQKAAENALAQRATGQQPSGQQPSGQQPSGQQPSGQQPSGQQPSGQQPSGQQPSGQQPSGQQPSGQQPSGQQPSGQQPSGQQPSGQQPSGQQPSGQQPSGQPITPQQAHQAGQLAARQQDIRQRTEALLAQQQQAASQIAQSQMSRLQQEQAQLAQEAAQLAQDVVPTGADNAQTGQQAAGNAQQAADQIPSNIGAAAQSATQAGQQLGALAQNLGQQAAQQATGQPSSGQPSSGQPSSGQPSSGQPSSGQPSSGQPSSGQPSSGQPSSGQPSSGQPSSGQPSSGQPSSGQPSSGQPSSGQPSTGQLAQDAAGLAERQQELAQQMQALAASQPQQALVAEQQSIQAQAQDLAQETAALADRAQAVAPQAAGQAQQATGFLNQAQQSAGQAGQAMASGTPQSAAGPQASAAQALGQAANALSNMGQALAQAAGQAPSSPATPAGPAMASAYGATSQAAQSQTTAAAAAAAQAMAAAASQAAGAAQGMGAQPGMAPGMGMMGMMPGQQPSQTLNSQKGIGAVAIHLTAAKLEALGIKLSDWARLPGELRNQILQAAEEAGPEEYRSLIKRYFQQVAKRGGAESEEQK
jgi:hypothetical protein